MISIARGIFYVRKKLCGSNISKVSCTDIKEIPEFICHITKNFHRNNLYVTHHYINISLTHTYKFSYNKYVLIK